MCLVQNLWVVYRPRWLLRNMNQDLYNVMRNQFQHTNCYCITGDFNFPDIDWSRLSSNDSEEKHFLHMLNEENMIQHVFESTTWHTRDTAVYATFWNLTKSPIMAFFMLDWRHIFNDIVIEFSAIYERSLSSRCEFLNQTFMITTLVFEPLQTRHK